MSKNRAHHEPRDERRTFGFKRPYGSSSFGLKTLRRADFNTSQLHSTGSEASVVLDSPYDVTILIPGKVGP